MTTIRQRTGITAALLIIGILAALVAAEILPDLASLDAIRVAAIGTGLGAASLVYLAAAAASVGIAIALHPLLAPSSPGLALGSVVFRSVEATFYSVAVVCLLALQSLGREPDLAGDLPLVLLVIRDQATLVGVLAFGAGALLYYLVFLRARLVPRWLAGWGVVGTLLLMVAAGLALFSGTPVTSYSLLIAPILVQELALAGWLLARGVSVPVPAREPSHQEVRQA
ncbi:MAG: DUF4386 domain-containing protein [Propionibacteriaceae bacterium]|nr:DUF4386 domain-containing protein [Propionibacteriaceae bacterium]